MAAKTKRVWTFSLLHKEQYKKFTRNRVGNVFYAVILVGFGLFSVLPLLYSILTSFKPLDELMIFPPPFFVRRPTTLNYRMLPGLLESLSVPMSRYVGNSLFISVVSTVLHVVVASMAAFVLSKAKIKGRKLIFAIVTFSLLYNAYTLEVPRYLIFSGLRMIDTYLVYILPAIPSAMGVFLMKQYMDSSVPDELLEAARIDGAGVLRIFWRIVMPIVRPAWLTLTLFSFRDIWSIIPGGTIFREELKTLPMVASTIVNGGLNRAGAAMAMTVLMMIPPILVYLISQRSINETMSTSGIK